MSTMQHDDLLDTQLDTQRRTPGDESPGYSRPKVATTPHEWGWQGGAS